jgi:hypothetical protein
MKEQTVLPRRVRAKYSTFVKTLTAIVLEANVACMSLLLPGASLSTWLVWGVVIGLIFVFAGLSPVWFEEHEDRYVLRLVAMSMTFDRAVYVATSISKKDLEGAIRLFASGGFCGFTGWFWSRRMGRFRCFASDLEAPLLRIHRPGEERGGVVVNG